MRVAVVGAGILGASVALRLAQGGARVWLLDKAEPASGTTSASFAWVNANNKTPREYFELNRAGMEEHLRLRAELPGGAPWMHRSGNLIWAAGKDFNELERRVERLRSWSYAAEWWTASRVKAELEPPVNFPDPDIPVAFFPEEGWVDAPLLTNTLIGLARRNDAEVRSSLAVRSVEMDGDRVSGIRLASGEYLPVDAVVNAAGPGADLVADLLGRELPLTPRRGLLACVAVDGEPLRRIFHSPRVNLRPDGPGHLLLHHPSVDKKLDDEPLAALCSELVERAREIMPALEGAGVVEKRVGTRPIPEDGFPCVGAVAGIPGYYEAVTHSGVTLGPLIGRLLAKEILAGEIDPLLAPFRPDRFDS
ncbi:MAG TPA: FAD-dependent oxidoreductase [Rubrobacteraceae bacterium]|nr:FAD-dependent oxidoreductase [Rubrobacteraceae bacterium]